MKGEKKEKLLNDSKIWKFSFERDEGHRFLQQITTSSNLATWAS